MAEEKKSRHQAHIKPTFAGDSQLPVHYINVASVQAGMEEFFVTLGTVMPPEIKDLKDLEDLDTIKAHPLFRFVVTRHTMKQILDVLQAMYEQQTKQIETLHTLDEKE
jgi:hypothetical protein